MVGGLGWHVLDRSGNLHRLHSNLPDFFNPQNVAAFAVQMIDCIKRLHLHEFIHGDIKPDNFTLGPKVPGDAGTLGIPRVNLIDFNASRSCAEGWEEKPASPLVFLTMAFANPAFASISVSLEHPLAKRDDLESLAYTLLYLLPGVTLPWLVEQCSASVKSEVVPEELCAGLPSVYARFLRYTRELEPTPEPDYDYYMEEFERASLPCSAYDQEQ